jgi:hypothetical protein
LLKFIPDLYHDYYAQLKYHGNLDYFDSFLEICETLKSFYLRDDISIIMRGHADTIAVQEGGLKITMKKRFLTFSFREVYIEFVKENGKIVSRSYFSDHRQKNVLLYGDIPHNVCACRMHEDFIA